VSFFAEVPSVIGPEDDDGVLGRRACVQGVEDPAHEGISEGDAGEIVPDGDPPLAGLAEPCEVIRFTSSELAASFRNVLEVVREIFWYDDAIEGIEVEVLLRNIPGKVRVEDATGEEERFVMSTLGEVLEVIDCVVGDQDIIVDVLSLRKDPPVRLFGIEFDAGVRELAGTVFCGSPRIQMGTVSNPAVIIEEVALEVIPLAGRIVAGGMMVDFSGAHGVVAIFAEVDRDGAELREVGFPPVLIVVDAGGGGEQSAHHGGPAGTAHRSTAMGIGESGASSRQAIEIGGVHLAGVSAKKSDPVVEIVEGEEENILLRGGARDGEVTQEEDGEGDQEA